MNQTTRQTLSEQIIVFRRQKGKTVAVLLFLGLVGLVLPIVPGLAFLALAFLLLFPRQGDDILRRIKASLKL